MSPTMKSYFTSKNFTPLSDIASEDSAEHHSTPSVTKNLVYDVTFLIVILLFSILLNACILWALVKRRNYNTSEHRAGKRHTSVGKRLLYNMCAASLGHSVIIIPFVLYNLWATTANPAETRKSPALVCNLFGLAFILPLTVVWLSEALVARDRYMAIVHTMEYSQQVGVGSTASKKAGKFILGTWTISLALIFIPAFMTQTFFHHDPNRMLCIFETKPSPSDTNNINAVHLIAFAGCYALTLLFMLRYYWSVLREASRRKNLPAVPMAAVHEIDNDGPIDAAQRASSSLSSTSTAAAVELKSRRLNMARFHRQMSRTCSSSSLTSAKSRTLPVQQQQLLITYRNRCKSLRTLGIIVVANMLTALPLLISLVLEYFVWSNDGSGKNSSTIPQQQLLIRWLTYWTFVKNLCTPLIYGFMNRSVRRDLLRAWRKSARQRQAAQQQQVIALPRKNNGAESSPTRRLSIGSHLLDFVPPYCRQSTTNDKPQRLSSKPFCPSYYEGSVTLIVDAETGSAARINDEDSASQNEEDDDRIVMPPLPPTRRRSLDDDGCPPSTSSLFFLKNQKFESPAGPETLLRRLERSRTQRVLPSRRRASDQLSRAEFLAMRESFNNGQINGNHSANATLSSTRRGSADSTAQANGTLLSSFSTNAAGDGKTTPSLTSSTSFLNFFRTHVGWRRRVSAPSCLQSTTIAMTNGSSLPLATRVEISVNDVECLAVNQNDVRVDAAT